MIRSNSLEVISDKCDNNFRNTERLAKHYKKSHAYICEICYEWEEKSFRGDAEITKHNNLIHETQDKTLTDQEFEDISLDYHRQIINGPNTPKRENLVKKKGRKKYKVKEGRI